MEKFCLIKAGKYLLGIEASSILKQQDIKSLIEDKQSDGLSLILLAPLFDMHNTAIFPEPESHVVEVKSSAGSQLLVVDSLSDAIITSARFESLPLLYPELLRLCCPQILICDDQPVLLLDSDGLQTILTTQENDFTVLSLAALREHYNKKNDIQDAQSAEEFDEASFNTVVSWTIAEFLKCGSDENCVISLDELLLESVSCEQLQGVSDDLVQEIIDKTLQKCGKFQNAAMQRLRQVSALTNP